MKVLNKVVIGMASLVLLTACGPSKISYDKYHEKAVAAAKKENGYTKVEVNGKAKITQEDDGAKTTVEYEFKNVVIEGFTNGRMTAAEITAKMIGYIGQNKKTEAAALTMATITAESVTKDDETVYYDDLSVSLKADDENRSAKFDENGLLKSVKFSGSGSGEVKFSWSK